QVQSLSRTTAIIRALASARSARMRLTDIARATGLTLSTTTRLLAAMAAERLVEAHDGGKTWKLGSELVYMGLSAARQQPLIRQASPHIEALAQETGDTAYLTVRCGDDSVCAFRAAGTHRAQAYATYIGSRRPLGIGAGGLALLVALPAEEIDAILQRNASKLAGYPHAGLQSLRHDMTAAVTRGYTYTENHLSGGVHAMGLAVRSTQGSLVAAVSVSAIAARLLEPRRGRIAQLLRDTAARIAIDLDATSLEE
ncbi:MAG TPA: IclR family transcriptional regulator C-terminal domain-containing protein, partial [Bordetella sp.]